MFKKKAREKKIKKPRFQVFRDAYKVTKQVKPWIPLALAGIFALTWALATGLGATFLNPYYAGFVSLPLAALLTLLFFTRQAGSASYAAIEGQIGAGASVLMAIRKGWTTTPAVSVSRNQDMVHRSVGRAGIVLTGEGTQSVRQMMADEKKKAERFAPGVPIIEILVGKEDGRIPIQKLQRHMRRLPKKLTAHQMREVRARLKAVGGMSMPIPKGPMPTRAPKIR
jgi:hypothetical protein